MESASRDRPHFGPFDVDLNSRQVRRQGVVLRLRGQPYDVLVALLERPGEVVTREDLRRRLWPDGTTVDFDHSLNTAVNKLRDILKDSTDKPRFIETLPRVGYRFLAPVDWRTSGDRSLAAAKDGVFGAPTESDQPRPRLPRRGLWASLALLAATLAVGLVGWRRPSRPERTMIAVLPFANLSGDPQLEYLSDGFTEEILTALGRRDAGLGVIARTSVMRYKNTQEPLDVIGRVLGVEYVLEGSVRSAADRIRVTAQLIRVRDQTHVWAQSYDGASQDLLRVQDEVANQVAAALNAHLPSRPSTPRSAPAPRSEVREAFLKGRYFWNKRTPASFDEAVAHFQRALDLDPSYAPAWAGLADCHFLMGTSGYPVLPAMEAFSRARREAEKALELDPSLGEAYPTLAAIQIAVDYNWTGAETLYRRAIELNPSHAKAYQWYALELARLSRTDEAIAMAEKAHRLDPLSLIIQTVIGLNLLHGGQPVRAAAECRKVIAMEEHFAPARGCVASALIEQDRHGEAVAMLEAARATAKDAPWLLAALVNARAASGDHAGATNDLRHLEKLAGQAVVPAYSLAQAHTGIGDREQAIESLERAYTSRDTGIQEINVDPFLDPVREDPRFQEIVRRVGLTPGPRPGAGSSRRLMAPR